MLLEKRIIHCRKPKLNLKGPYQHRVSQSQNCPHLQPTSTVGLGSSYSSYKTLFRYHLLQETSHTSTLHDQLGHSTLNIFCMHLPITLIKISAVCIFAYLSPQSPVYSGYAPIFLTKDMYKFIILVFSKSIPQFGMHQMFNTSMFNWTRFWFCLGNRFFYF